MAHLLIVDDDVDAAESLAEVMRMEGHEVVVAYNGQTGLWRVRERKPDLVLLDVEMPILDGPKMAYVMFLHDMGMEKIPVVLISGVADLSQVAQQVGTPYFLTKRFRFDALLAVVEQALTERVPPTPFRPSGC